MSCYCYIVECVDGSYYTGWTTDPQRRVRTHNSGRGARYTRMRGPVRLVYVEEQPDRSTAMKRERTIKALTREKKRQLIEGHLLAPDRPARPPALRAERAKRGAKASPGGEDAAVSLKS